MSQPLFDALQEIGDRIAAAPHLLLCLDFDGALAPIVEDPTTVYLSPQMHRVLLSLAGHEDASLCLISGRNRVDLQAHVGIPGLIYVGNHGLEISGPGCLFIEPTAADSTAAIKALAADLDNKLQRIPGAFVEDKGLTLSVHYRLVPAEQSAEVRQIVHTVLATTNHPFHLTMGDMVYEVRPRTYWDKGMAVHWINEQVGKPDAVVIYVGADATDEDAFAALPEAITVKVGEFAETAALYFLENPAQVRRFLEYVEVRLQQKAACLTAR